MPSAVTITVVPLSNRGMGGDQPGYFWSREPGAGCG